MTPAETQALAGHGQLSSEDLDELDERSQPTIRRKQDMKQNEQQFKPMPVNMIDVAFGGHAMEILPPWEQIPDEFKHGYTKWNKIASRWYFRGLPKGTEFKCKPGIDKTPALANIQCALSSFEPKHEHKEAGVAYLMSLWFDDIVIPEAAATGQTETR